MSRKLLHCDSYLVDAKVDTTAKIRFVASVVQD